MLLDDWLECDPFSPVTMISLAILYEWMFFRLQNEIWVWWLSMSQVLTFFELCLVELVPRWLTLDLCLVNWADPFFGYQVTVWSLHECPLVQVYSRIYLFHWWSTCISKRKLRTMICWTEETISTFKVYLGMLLSLRVLELWAILVSSWWYWESSSASEHPCLLWIRF